MDEIYTEEELSDEERQELREEEREERRRRRKERSLFQKLLTLANLFYLGSFVFAIISYFYPYIFLKTFFSIYFNKYMLAVFPVLGALVLFANLFLFYSRNPLKWLIRILVSLLILGMIVLISAVMIYNYDQILNMS